MTRRRADPRAPARPGPAPRLLLLMLVAGSAASCGLDRHLSGALTRTLDQAGAHYRGGAGRDSLLATTDSLAGYLARALAGSALPVLDSAEVRLLTRLRSELGETLVETRDTITGALAVHWSPALAELIDRGIAQAGGRGQEELAALLVRVQLEAQRSLLPTINEAVSGATVAALDQLALRLGPRFEAGLIALADSVARVGARAAVGQTTPIWKNLQWLLVLGAALGFAGLAAWSHLRGRRLAAEHEKSMASLAVLSDAIRAEGGRPVADAVRQRARHRGIEPWLHEFLVKQGTLVPGSAPAETPAFSPEHPDHPAASVQPTAGARSRPAVPHDRL